LAACATPIHFVTANHKVPKLRGQVLLKISLKVLAAIRIKCALDYVVPSLDDWEKGWNEKLKAETLKLEMPMPKVLPVDFRAQQVVAVARGAESPLVSIAQSN
jgi:hypothetical protein